MFHGTSSSEVKDLSYWQTLGCLSFEDKIYCTNSKPSYLIALAIWSRKAGNIRQIWIQILSSLINHAAKMPWIKFVYSQDKKKMLFLNSTPNRAKKKSFLCSETELSIFRCVRIQVADEISDTFEISGFEDAGIVVTSWQGFPDLSWALADFEESAHMARWYDFV